MATSNFSQTQWAVEGPYGPGYISPTALLAKREVRNKIFDRYSENDLFEFLIQSNRKGVSANRKFSWFEHDFLHHVATTASITGTTGAGNPATITLASGSHLESGVRSLFQETDLVKIYTAAGTYDGYVTATNKTSANAHTITVQPAAGVDLVSNLGVSGDRISLISNAAASGSSQPTSRRRQPISFDAYCQVIKSRFKVAGGEAAERSEVEVNGKPFYYLQGAVDAATAQKMAINFQFLVGTSSSGSDFTDPDTGDAVYVSDSLESVIDARGNSETYTTFAISNVQNMVKLWNRQRAAKEQMLLAGINLDVDIDSFAKGYLDNTAINYAAWGKGNASLKAVDFGFNSISYAGYTIHKQCADALNYGGSLGYTSSKYPDMGFTVPMDAVSNKGKLMDTISVMTLESDRGSRYMREDVKDLFKQTSGEDAFAFDMLSDVGLRLIGANQMFKIAK